MQWVGYAAAVLVFCTFYMRTMLPLRAMAIASNVAFLAYAIPLGLWPIVILHGLLLPLNIRRLLQIRQMLEHVHAARGGEIDVSRFLASLSSDQRPQGTVLFRKGDMGDDAWFIASGEIELPELGVRRGQGSFIGEVAIFSSKRVRTASAICATDVVLYQISERDLVVAFYQSPELAFAIVRTIADRMSETSARAEI
jgi:CRP/FNR family transcriptional regulator, cyclic AMP receptor protein